MIVFLPVNWEEEEDKCTMGTRWLRPVQEPLLSGIRPIRCSYFNVDLRTLQPAFSGPIAQGHPAAGLEAKRGVKRGTGTGAEGPGEQGGVCGLLVTLCAARCCAGSCLAMVGMSLAGVYSANEPKGEGTQG